MFEVLYSPFLFYSYPYACGGNIKFFRLVDLYVDVYRTRFLIFDKYNISLKIIYNNFARNKYRDEKFIILF